MEALKAVMERSGAELCVAHLHWWVPKRLALRLLLPVHLLPSHIFSSQRKRQSRNGGCCSGGHRAAARRSGSGLNPWNGTVATLWWDGWSLFCLSCFFPRLMIHPISVWREYLVARWVSCRLGSQRQTNVLGKLRFVWQLMFCAAVGGSGK